MAGHSKWANIQHRKGAQDKKRGKLFTKLIREITVAAQRLVRWRPERRIRGSGWRSIKRKGKSMPKDNIERAIKRGSGRSSMDGTIIKRSATKATGPAAPPSWSTA